MLAELTEPRRFSELRAALPVTARALALALRDLENAGLVRRTVTDDRPPQTRYEATDPKLVAAARAL